jgi:hypothetical protein
MEKAELDKISGWFAGRLPDGWFTGAPKVTADDGHILVTGTLSDPTVAAEASAEERAGAEAGRIARFREGTRGWRIEIAREAERQFKLPVTWAATCGGTTITFTRGGSGRGEGSAEAHEEARKVMIAARRRALRAWRRRFAFGGPPAWRRSPWWGGRSPWWGGRRTEGRGPWSGGDYQSF